MTYLLDTDHVSVLQRPGGRGYDALVVNLNLHDADGIGVSVVSYHEQSLGAHNKIIRARDLAAVVQAYELMLKVIDVFRRFPVVPFDDGAADAFETLKARKVRVGTTDLRIASVALAYDLTLVTRNVSDFGRVPGLRTADWTV